MANATTGAERLAIGSRVAAAVLGGYAFAAAASVFLSRVLPMTRADAVLTATLASFALYAAAAVWAFAARSALRAWIGLLLPTVLFWAIGVMTALTGAGS